ncbi:MAG: hypothetical protein O7F73_19080 [Gammaproteobacteria bacterium]|nr:hypothetical protein [Gammaproteobacteria bacterium]
MPVFFRLRPLFLLCLLLSPGVTLAREQHDPPTPYGLNYYRASTQAAEPAVRILRSAPEAARYRSQVEAAELAHGPYSPLLGETLADEAIYLEQQGDHEAAINSLRRAVHVTRINDGLHSAMQLPLVRRLFDNYLAVGDLEMADDTQQYLYFLGTQSQQLLSPEKVAAALELANWRRQTWLVELHDRNLKRWYNSYQLIDDALDELQKQELEQAPLELLEPLSYAQLRHLYLLGEGEFGLREELQLTLNRSSADEANQQMSREERQLQHLQQGAYSLGRKLLEQLSQAHGQAGGRRGQARAELYLADWHIWHNRSTRAGEHYRQSWQLLGDPELHYLREEWFAEPMELPLDDVFHADSQLLPAGTVWVPVRLRFAVSAQGKPRDIETLALAEQHEVLGYRIKRWLRAARYRPRVESGEPVASAVLEREYLVAE